MIIADNVNMEHMQRSQLIQEIYKRKTISLIKPVCLGIYDYCLTSIFSLRSSIFLENVIT